MRHALAHSRQSQVVPESRHSPPEPSQVVLLRHLWDEDLSRLSPGRARQTLKSLAGPGELARLAWWQTAVVVSSSRAPVAAARATAVQLEVRSGRRRGEGRALAAGRSLEALMMEDVFQRARDRQSDEEPGAPSDAPTPTLLAPEACAQIVIELNRMAFTSQSYRSGSSFLRDHLGKRVFHPLLTVMDDGTCPDGMPFPFDLAGQPKRPVTLILEGVPRSSAVDEALGRSLGLPATPHVSTLDDCRAEHLFVAPGDHSHDGLLAAAEGGVWIGWWDRTECFDPRKARIRATTRGARRIRNGSLAEPLGPLLWEDSLLGSLAEIRGVGQDSLILPGPDPSLGAISAPSLLLGEVSLRPV